MMMRPFVLPRALGLPWLLGLLALLTACGPMQAQNPSGSWGPVNAVEMGADERVLLKGADVVAYFTQGRHVQGVPEHQALHQGVTLYFASDEHRQRFEQAPEQYLPQFGGYCSNGIVYGIPWGGDADTWKIIDGQLFIFGGRASQEAFELDVPGNLALARQYWASEVVQGSHSFVQRAKRLVWRVPHYQSGQELADAVARAKAAAQ